MKNTLILLSLCFMFLTGCLRPSDQRATEAARANGLTDVNVTGTDWFACSESDMSGGREITATNAQGQTVHAVVCCGVWKRCTVRY